LIAPDVPFEDFVKVGEESFNHFSGYAQSGLVRLFEKWTIEDPVKYLKGSNMTSLSVKQF
jgi:hypothetical protein